MVAYIIKDREEPSIYGIVKEENPTNAKYKIYQEWSKELGLSYWNEFKRHISCIRCPQLDDLDFYYFDGRNFSKEYKNNLTIGEIRAEIMSNNEK